MDECTDEHGNITLYALAELKGWQVATLLDQQGGEWNDADSATQIMAFSEEAVCSGMFD